ncbi:MAG: cytochrome c oxidase subunit I, partial [Candidatus Limnocylindria bacterium]
MATTTLEPQAGAYRRSWVIDWLTTVDHKKIGILYIVNSFLFFFAAGILALVIRTELTVPGMQFLDQDTYNQAFTMHGTIMLFLFIIPALSGFANYIVPLQLGAPDMAFPRINALSFWLLPLGGILIFSGYLFGGAAAEGWTGYSPLTSDQYAPGVGTDLWIIGLTLVGTASILGAVNFIATIFKMRAPGMTLFRMPIFVWT